MWANETLEKAVADKVWKIHQCTIEHRNYAILAISRETGQFLTIIYKEKYKTLRATLYQELLSLLTSIKADLSSRQDNEISFKKVTYTEVQDALSSLSSNTAISTSYINYTMLK